MRPWFWLQHWLSSWRERLRMAEEASPWKWENEDPVPTSEAEDVSRAHKDTQEMPQIAL